MTTDVLPAEPLTIEVTAAASEVLALRAVCATLLPRLQTWQNVHSTLDTRPEQELLMSALNMPIVYACSYCGEETCTPADRDAWSGTYCCRVCAAV
jgi:hypothetical protein